MFDLVRLLSLAGAGSGEQMVVLIKHQEIGSSGSYSLCDIHASSGRLDSHGYSGKCFPLVNFLAPIAFDKLGAIGGVHVLNGGLWNGDLGFVTMLTH